MITNQLDTVCSVCKQGKLIPYENESARCGLYSQLYLKCNFVDCGEETLLHTSKLRDVPRGQSYEVNKLYHAAKKETVEAKIRRTKGRRKRKATEEKRNERNPTYLACTFFPITHNYWYGFRKWLFAETLVEKQIDSWMFFQCM